MRIVIVSLAFNVYWFAAVLGQNDLLPFLVIALLVSVFIDRGVVKAVPLITLIGVWGDSVLTYAQVLNFNTTHIPLWLGMLWAGFAAFVWLVRDWLFDKPRWLLTSVGTVGGAMSYLGGEKLGGVTFSLPLPTTVAVLAVAWFLYTTIFLSLLKRLSRQGETCETTTQQVTETSLTEKD